MREIAVLLNPVDRAVHNEESDGFQPRSGFNPHLKIYFLKQNHEYSHKIFSSVVVISTVRIVGNEQEGLAKLAVLVFRLPGALAPKYV